MTNPKRVLVVEDDKAVQQLFQKLLEKRKAAVTVVSSGREANRLLTEKHHYNLVFLDLILPEVTGWEVLEKLRANPATSATPVVIFTGAALSNDEKEKMLKKVNMVVEKNQFSLEVFDRILDQWL